MTDVELPVSKNHSAAWIGGGLLALAALVAAFRYLPILDYPDWLYQGFLLREIGAGSDLGQAFRVTPYLAPNSLVTMLIALLATVLPVLTAGKAILLLALISQFLGLYIFMRTVSRCPVAVCALTAFMLTPGYFFFQGNLGYLLGMGVALLTPRVLALRPEGRRVALLTLMLPLAYLSHFVAFAFLLLFLLEDAFRTRSIRLLTHLALPLLATGGLLVHYALASRGILKPHYAYVFRGNGGLVGYATEQLSMFVGPFKLFRGFNGISAPHPVREGLNLLTVLTSFAAVGAGLWIGLRRRCRLAWLALVLIAVMAALPTHFGGMFRPAERLVPVILTLSLALLWESGGRFRPFLTGLLALAAAGVIAYDVACAAAFNRIIERGDAAAALPPRKGWHYPFDRFKYYEAIEKKIALPGAYVTGLVIPRAAPSAEPEGAP